LCIHSRPGLCTEATRPETSGSLSMGVVPTRKGPPNHTCASCAQAVVRDNANSKTSIERDIASLDDEVDELIGHGDDLDDLSSFEVL
jgi:hypothetical protein